MMSFFWYRRQGRVADFNSQVAAGDHDGVGCFDNGSSIFQRFHPFKFRYDPRIRTCLVQQRTGLDNVGGATGKGNGKIIGADLNAVHQVLVVFFGQGACGKSASFQVDAFVVRQLPADDNRAAHPRLYHADYFQGDAPVIDQQGIPGIDIPGPVPGK